MEQKRHEMDDNMMKDNVESNSKENSLAKAIIVHWKWDDNRVYRDFLNLRYGGSAETQYDLDMKYPEDSNESETVVVHSEQLISFSDEERVQKIVSLLDSETWKWNPEKHIDFRAEVEKTLK